MKMDAVTRKKIAAVIAKYAAELQKPGVLAIEPGYPIVHGWVVEQPAIKVFVTEKKPRATLLSHELLPRSLGGFPVDVVQASVERQLVDNEATAALARELTALDASALTYQPIPGNPIDEVFTVAKPFLCHVGPDAGWPVLKRFIEQTRTSLSVAMYDFNANWVAKTLIETLKDADAHMVLTWDDGINADESKIRRRLRDQLGARLDAWIVQCGGNRRFASAYHEKVAVRDGQAFWLSSGNWSRRSQPDIDPIADPEDAAGMYSAGNREWHVIVENEPLAKLFEQYIHYDRDGSKQENTALRAPRVWPDLFVPIAALAAEVAAAVPRPIAPERLPRPARSVKVRPLLTPDNYANRIRELIAGARKRIYLQFSYITYSRLAKDAEFRAMLDLLAERSNDDELDVRIIVGSGNAQEKVAVLVEEGFNDEAIRVQTGVHNKGIVVDGERVLVSSANWSGDGVLRNRDAGLLIEDPAVAEYYERVFLFDWEQRARQFIDQQAATVLIAAPGAPVPSGYVRMRWDDYYGE
jgi:phosphatidylserine/phosphatidylglycerophosphate/cardiolipin synthase-like enzyme